VGSPPGAIYALALVTYDMLRQALSLPKTRWDCYTARFRESLSPLFLFVPYALAEGLRNGKGPFVDVFAGLRSAFAVGAIGNFACAVIAHSLRPHLALLPIRSPLTARKIVTYKAADVEIVLRKVAVITQC